MPKCVKIQTSILSKCLLKMLKTKVKVPMSHKPLRVKVERTLKGVGATKRDKQSNRELKDTQEPQVGVGE